MRKLTCFSSSSSSKVSKKVKPGSICSRRTDRWVHFQQNAGLWLFVHTWIVQILISVLFFKIRIHSTEVNINGEKINTLFYLILFSENSTPYYLAHFHSHFRIDFYLSNYWRAWPTDGPTDRLKNWALFII